MNKTILSAALAVLTTTTAGAEMKPYVGIDFGAMAVDYSTVAGIDGSTLFADDFTTVSPYLGLDVTDHFAVELGYLQSSEESKNVGSGTVDTTFSGFYLDAVGTYPVSDAFTALGTVGVARVKAEADAVGAGGSITVDGTEAALRLGVGGEYAVSDAVNVRGMVRYMNLDFEGIDSAMQYTLGVNYAF